MEPANPQSLDRHAGACPERSPRVTNNPASLNDPLGLYVSDDGPYPCDSPDFWMYAECGLVGPLAAPPTPPPLAGDGSEFIHNPVPGLSPAHPAMLKGALIAGAAALLDLSAEDLQSPALPTISTSIQGGALNVDIKPTGDTGFLISPTADALSNHLRDPIFEPGMNHEIRSDGVVPVGPGDLRADEIARCVLFARPTSSMGCATTGCWTMPFLVHSQVINPRGKSL